MVDITVTTDLALPVAPPVLVVEGPGQVQRRAEGVMEQQTPAAVVAPVLLVVLPVQTMVVEERVVLEF